MSAPLSMNQAKALADDGKQRPAPVRGSSSGDAVTKGEHDGYRNEEQNKQGRKGHDEGVRQMQTRSQSHNPSSTSPKKNVPIHQPGGGARGN